MKVILKAEDGEIKIDSHAENSNAFYFIKSRLLHIQTFFFSFKIQLLLQTLTQLEYICKGNVLINDNPNYHPLYGFLIPQISES